MSESELPKDAAKDTAEVLRRRADWLARTVGNEQARKLAFEVAIVRVGNEQFGLPTGALREIVAIPPIAPLPGLPAYLLGIAQIRGTILSVLDLAKYLNVDKCGEWSELVVIEDTQGALGVLVEQVIGFRTVYTDQLAESFSSLGGGGRPDQAMTTDVVAVLDLRSLLASDRLIVG